MFFIHKGTITKSVKQWTQQEINNYLDDGWIEGKCPAHWYNNGTINKLIKEGEPVPEGFQLGQSESFKQKTSESGLRRWQNMSQEKRNSIALKISDTVSKQWEAMPQEERNIRNINRLKTVANWSDEERQLYSNKMSQSAIADRKTRTAEQNKCAANKGFLTRKQNGTLNTSSKELEFETALLQFLTKDDFETSYNKDERYPYHCDFYIKALDLFIELNFHFTHGEHPYDASNPTDRQELEKIRLKQGLTESGKKNSYYVKEEVWTKRDVNKVKCAIKNNLNYYAIYTLDQMHKCLEDIKSKLILKTQQ